MRSTSLRTNPTQTCVRQQSCSSAAVTRGSLRPGLTGGHCAAQGVWASSPTANPQHRISLQYAILVLKLQTHKYLVLRPHSMGAVGRQRRDGRAGDAAAGLGPSALPLPGAVEGPTARTGAPRCSPCFPPRIAPCPGCRMRGGEQMERMQNSGLRRCSGTNKQ